MDKRLLTTSGETLYLHMPTTTCVPTHTMKTKELIDDVGSKAATRHPHGWYCGGVVPHWDDSLLHQADPEKATSLQTSC